MKTFAEFQIIGRVSQIKTVGPTLRIGLAAEYGRKDDNGQFQQNTFWNEVTLFNTRTIAWVTDNVGKGDLVHTRGTIRQTKYTDKDGVTQYGVTLAANSFDLLAKKKPAPEQEEQQQDQEQTDDVFDDDTGF